LSDKSTRFLLHDNGIDERIIVFATDNGLKYLTEASTWYMDGNFTMDPLIFQQLYVIRVIFVVQRMRVGTQDGGFKGSNPSRNSGK
jgi:hypothetical protein